MTNINDFNKTKKLLRKADIDLNETQKISKEFQQAKEFVASHNKRDIDAFLRIYDTEVFADALDWLIFRNAVFETNKKYNAFPSDMHVFVKDLMRARNSMKG